MSDSDFDPCQSDLEIPGLEDDGLFPDEDQDQEWAESIATL
jgi:hypothetical protein